MAKAKKVKGKDLMAFVNDKAIALATNHTLKLTAETGDSSTKDSGDWGDEEITKMTWEATSENLCSADEGANSYEQMLDLMLAREPVEVKVGIPTNATNDEVPEGGWTVPQKYYGGTALITDIQLNAQNGDNATMSITLAGKGQLKKSDGVGG